MSLPRIELHEVSKQFRLGRHGTGTLKDDFIRLFSRRRPPESPEAFWALKDVSLKIYDGEVVGIVGSNGAGKSTLLRIVAQIMTPTSGEVVVRGRVTPLLSLGLGFHAELTGRENIYHTTSFYGITRAQTNAFYDAIVEFSELGPFIEEPLKGYSNGMRVRLGFSVAIHLNPDILVIDEVLAAGDEQFRKKSQAKMQEVLQSGTTVLLASHNMALMEQLCTRVYWLDKGTIVARGDAAEVIEQYRHGASVPARPRPLAVL